MKIVERLRLAAVRPYSFELTVHKPAGWHWLTPGEVWEDETIWSGLRSTTGKPIGIRARASGTTLKPAVVCEIFSKEPPSKYERLQISTKVAGALGVSDDIRPFYTLANRDPILKQVVKDLYGMRAGVWPDLFSAAVLSITLQMAPVARSRRMMNALIENYGDRIELDRKTIRLLPSPERIASTKEAELKRKCGLGYRARALKRVARQISAGFPTLEELKKMSPQAAMTRLMELYGIGEYSAEMITPHPSFPLDVWSVQIFAKLFGVKLTDDPRSLIPRIKKLADRRWEKWRWLALVYVLNDLSNLGVG
jgi:3-methyladenine DNA glycosylase/8-oxoguanine DNA glycosylase